MKVDSLVLFFFVIVTGPSQVRPQLPTSDSTSKIIRFSGSSYIRYTLNTDTLTLEPLNPTSTESHSFLFTTYNPNGLLWLFTGSAGQKMHLSVKDGLLYFVSDDGVSSPQKVLLRPSDGSKVNDNRWHTFKVEKDGTLLKFYLDGRYVTQMRTPREIQFIAPGEIYMGGAPNIRARTDGEVTYNYDGALTDVEYVKDMGADKTIVVYLLRYIQSATPFGNITIIDREDWNKTYWWWTTARPTLPPTPPPTPPPARPTPITFIEAATALYLSDALDLRRGGSISFQFRTLEPRGLLMFARGSAQSVNFIATEVFDGKLYFVYDFGSFSDRRRFSERRVDDGVWHDVNIRIENNELVLSLDGRTFTTGIPASEIYKMYFYRIYVGGYDDFRRIPWPLYSRQGYKGCLQSLKINNIGVDLHRLFAGTALRGVVMQCQTPRQDCQNQPCVSGSCSDRMSGYKCDCANTPYTGQNCNENAVIASWDGTYFTNFEFVNREVTHTNDISVRFMTPLANALIFRTVGDTADDYIQAELENGRVKVTFRADGHTKIFYTGQNLNDYRWHTLYIKRRATDVDIWVDDGDHTDGLLDGENFSLKIDRIRFGAAMPGSVTQNSYIGYMQNFRYEDRDLFKELKQRNTNVKWIINVNPEDLPILTYKPVTVTTSETYFQLPSLSMGLMMKIMFKFKTRETNGLLLYNQGRGNDVFAIELDGGKVRFAYNMGGRNTFFHVPTPDPLNDNQWHTVILTINERGQVTAKVDNTMYDVAASGGDRRLDLTGSLYIGGFPADMFKRPDVAGLLLSRKGFRGCLASMDLNGAVPELTDFAIDRSLIKTGCQDILFTCKPGACGSGVCVPMAESYWCDCNMTGLIGTPCADHPIGYYFGKAGEKGIIVYEYPFGHTTQSDVDRIAFGFMTKEADGVLMRLQSSVGGEYIEIRLENGHIVAVSKTGAGVNRVVENRQLFNDGMYHVVQYVRTGYNSSLQVNSLTPNVVQHSGGVSVFDDVYMVMIGGKRDSQGAMMSNFNGIIGGVYWNGHRWMDMLFKGKTLYGKSVKMFGDVVLTKPFILVKPPPVTKAPPAIVIPPDAVVPGSIGGGGVSGIGISGSGGGGGGGPTGIGGPGGIVSTGVGFGTQGAGPVAGASVGGTPIPPGAFGARAGAVVGAVLGTLAFVSSLMWAGYLLKPGIPAFLSPGAGSAGGGGGAMSISSPRTAGTNLGAVQAAGGGAGAGGGAAKLTVVNGSASAGAGGAGAGGGSSTYTSYFQSTSTSVAGGGGGGSAVVAGGGADAIDSATLRSTAVAGGGGGGAGSGYSYERNYMSSTSSAGGGGIPDYDIATGTGTLQSGAGGYSTSTLASNYNYQVHNLKTMTINRSGQYVIGGGGGSVSGAVTPGAAGDEIRVDCCLMTGSGNSVITGSSLGPPQVWDMSTGELLRIMKGDTVGSTHLHLACGDKLLVGSVHADLEINEYSGRKGVFNHTLQIWDFVTGKPLDMANGQYCSALCVMSDNDKVLFGRTDKFGDATSIIAWDLMGNQLIKEMRYDAPIGNNDYISYLNLSKNDRYVVAGFTNTFDNHAEFLVFDMTLTSMNINDPALLRLDANPECTAILPRDEAVTGLRNGDLVVWSLRSGQPSRQLLSGSGLHAHSREVKAVVLSEDSRYLVSASADKTLKVWDMETERPIHTLIGHTDDVICASISPDNEIIVSGSADGTIRLWRMKNGSEMCVFNTGVDIFFVTMSHDKGTIVALGDKFGARKLIMLQIVRTKIKKIISS